MRGVTKRITRFGGVAVACAALLSAGGCGDGKTKPHDDHAHGSKDGHGHGEEALSELRFGERFELFVEHPPLVAGRPVTFTAHFTILGERFAPVRAGRVEVSLRGAAGVAARVGLDKPSRTGIFEPTLKAPAAGEYTLSFGVEAEGARDTFSWKVRVHGSAHEAAHRPQPPRAAGEEIPFLKEQQWVVPFATAAAERRPLRDGFEVAATVDAEPGAHARLTAPIGGVVSGVAPDLRVGAKVTARQTLASVEPVLLQGSDLPQLQLALVHARQGLKLAELRRDRLRKMLAARAISQLEVDRAEYEVKRQQAELRAAGSRLWLHQKSRRKQRSSGHGVKVISPIAGTVVQRGVTQGAAVVAGQLLVEIADLSRLRVVAHVASADLLRARRARGASLRLPGGRWVALGQPPDLGARVDPRTRTVPLYYGWTATEVLPLGTWVRVRLLGERRTAVAVPDGAVLDDDGQTVVLVQTGGESFALRKVALGARDRGFTEVTLGLQAGERVVTVGGYQILLAAKLRGGAKLGHGHAH